MALLLKVSLPHPPMHTLDKTPTLYPEGKKIKLLPRFFQILQFSVEDSCDSLRFKLSSWMKWVQFIRCHGPYPCHLLSPWYPPRHSMQGLFHVLPISPSAHTPSRFPQMQPLGIWQILFKTFGGGWVGDEG